MTAFITAAMDVICSTTVPVGTRPHWSPTPGLYGLVETGWPVLWTGSAVWLANQNNLDKDCSQHTHTRARAHVYAYTAVFFRHKHTNAHTPLHGYGLSTGPILKASARGGWEIGHSRQPTTTDATDREAI